MVHTELGPVKRKQRTKMSSVKATVEQVTAMIPICADAKDVCSFIRACDYACEAVDKDSTPLLVKFINTRITGKTVEVCR
ncbi:myb-like protein D [Aphis craccivora]|uniref:Myb-like protein D n=1 Tax=Aphis craccivora TaxID=307492 RepID=A0A6G0Z113_APHCR|nr:myb-like protein D [Aphis craccivora]